MKKLLIFGFLFLSYSLSIHAQTSYKIANLVSQDGEAKDAFLKRAGRYMEDLTYQYKFEFCSRLWQSADGNKLMLNISTVQSQVGCIIPREMDVGGYWVPLALTIHTHPQFSRSTANQVDVILNPGRYNLGDPITIDNNHFSSTDYAAGPGFLVVREHLLFQHVANEEIDLGSIDPPASQ